MTRARPLQKDNRLANSVVRELTAATCRNYWNGRGIVSLHIQQNNTAQLLASADAD